MYADLAKEEEKTTVCFHYTAIKLTFTLGSNAIILQVKGN